MEISIRGVPGVRYLTEVIFPAASDFFNMLRRWSNYNANISSGPGIAVSQGSKGQVIRLGPLQGLSARLIATSVTGEYNGTQVLPGPDGTWTDVVGVPPLTGIKEDNALGGLGGKVVKLTPNYGAWRFNYKRRGVHDDESETCTAHRQNAFVKVRASGAPGAATITITGPKTATLTSSSTTLVTFNADKSGAYTVTITAPNCVTYTGGFGVNCANPFDTTTTVELQPKAGYTCTQYCCTATGSKPYLIVAVPGTLFVNDGFGTVTCNLVGTGDSYFGGNYRGVAARTVSAAFNCHTGLVVPGPVDVNIYFFVNCRGQVSLGYSTCGIYGPPCGGDFTAPMPVAGEEHFGCGGGFDGPVYGGCGGMGGVTTPNDCPDTSVSVTGSYRINKPIPGSGVPCYGFGNLQNVYPGRDAEGNIVFPMTVTS